MAKDQGCFLSLSESFAKLSQNGCFLRTSQHSPEEGWTQFSESWPKSGLMRRGQCYRLHPAEQVIPETEYGYWPTPTVQDSENNGGPAQHLRNTIPLNAAVMYPIEILPLVLNNKHVRSSFFHWAGNLLSSGQTATVIRSNAHAWLTTQMNANALDQHRMESSTDLPLIKRCLEEGVLTAGKLNPMWTGWLMGFPAGWHSCDPLETHKYHLWQQQHGNCLKILCGEESDEMDENS